ncbi:MAG TPA: hypothetical protein VEK14_03695, partial [Rhodomicrobium sp.]|nr:hypothetical protein [Rhodomicrobium sp.]
AIVGSFPLHPPGLSPKKSPSRYHRQTVAPSGQVDFAQRDARNRPATGRGLLPADGWKPVSFEKAGIRRVRRNSA